MRIQYFVKVSNPFDVTCGEEKPREDETPLLEKTMDVVTQPSYQIISLDDVAIEQKIETDVLLPLTSAAKKRIVAEILAGESASKKKKGSKRRMTRKPFTYQVERAKNLLGLIHIDVCGPFRTVSRQGASYFVTFIDDFWSLWLCLLAQTPMWRL
nr:retrotransposon protein, putative, Ty1-copia subclass [Tanacetum cinerariifolium]